MRLQKPHELGGAGSGTAEDKAVLQSATPLLGFELG
jgi:hypothetical protein